MKKDITVPEVEDIAIAIIPEDIDGETGWRVYLLNLKDIPIQNALIVSKGYGELEGEARKTSTLRHFFPEIPAKTYAKIERIMEFTFGLNNEYWVSFYIDGMIYDKRYVFLPESIVEENFTTVPLLDMPGVMIR